MKLSNLKRGSGICLNSECDDFHKDVYLFNHGPYFWCPRCKYPGRTVMETREILNNRLDFWQARVEFSYSPALDKYRDVAIVIDNSMDPTGNIYTLRTPIVKTDKRALLIAEGLLASLMTADERVFGEDMVAKPMEFLLDFDQPAGEVKKKLTEWAATMERSQLRRT